MLTPAHIAASYLLSQTPYLFHQSLSSGEVIAVILAGNIVDLDFVWGVVRKKSGDDHHKFITHTPLFAVGLWLSLFLFFKTFSSTAWILMLIAGLLHLVLGCFY